MRLKITHTTHYTYGQAPEYGLQRLRLTPPTSTYQSVVDWNLGHEGAHPQANYVDCFGNRTHLIKIDSGATKNRITASGTVEVDVDHGIIGHDVRRAPHWLFASSTSLTGCGPELLRFCDQLPPLDSIGALHDLSGHIRDKVAYQTDCTHSGTTAEDAFVGSNGVCQDHSHIFLAVARKKRINARYVSGYLCMDDRVDQVASHAWVEAWVKELGWIGFDVSNGISPDNRYVKVAVGRDYVDAAPIVGLRTGPSDETMNVTLAVEQQ